MPHPPIPEPPGMSPEDRRTLTVALVVIGGGFLAGVVLLFVFFATGL